MELSLVRDEYARQSSRFSSTAKILTSLALLGGAMYGAGNSLSDNPRMECIKGFMQGGATLAQADARCIHENDYYGGEDFLADAGLGMLASSVLLLGSGATSFVWRRTQPNSET